MKITVQSTTKIVHANGVRCRVWEGQNESGLKLSCLVASITPNKEDDRRGFEAELGETPLPPQRPRGLGGPGRGRGDVAPSAEADAAWPARIIVTRDPPY